MASIVQPWMGSLLGNLNFGGAPLKTSNDQEFHNWLSNAVENERYKELLRKHREEEEGFAAWREMTRDGEIIHPLIRFLANFTRNRKQRALAKHREKKGEMLLRSMNDVTETSSVLSMVTLGRDGVLRDTDGNVLTDRAREELKKEGKFQYSIPITSQHTGFTIHGQTYVMGAQGGLLNQQGKIYGEGHTSHIARLAAEQTLFTANRERGNVDCPASVNAMLKGVRGSLENILTGQQQTPITSILREFERQGVREAGKVDPGNKGQVAEFLRKQGMGRLVAHIKEENGGAKVEIDGKTVENFLWEHSEYKKLLDKGDQRTIAEVAAKKGVDPNRFYVAATGQFLKDAAEDFLRKATIQDAGIDSNSSPRGVQNWLRSRGISANVQEVSTKISFSIGYESSHPGFDIDGRAANFFKLCYKLQPDGSYKMNEQFVQMLPRGARSALAKLEQQSSLATLMRSAADIGNASSSELYLLRKSLDAVLKQEMHVSLQAALDKIPATQGKTLSSETLGAISRLLDRNGGINKTQLEIENQHNPAAAAEAVTILENINAAERQALGEAASDNWDSVHASLKARLDEIFIDQGRGAISLSHNERDLLSRALNNDGSPNQANLAAEQNQAAAAKVKALLDSLSDEDRYALRLEADADRARALGFLDSSARIQESPEWQNMFARQIVTNAGVSDLDGKDFDRNNPSHEAALRQTLMAIIEEDSAGGKFHINKQAAQWQQQPEWLRKVIESAPPEKITALGNLVKYDYTNTGEIAKELASFAAPHFARVLSDPDKCKAQIDAAKDALRNGTAASEPSIFVPLMQQAATGTWQLNDNLVGRALDTSRLLAHQAEELHLRKSGFQETYRPEHRNTHGLQAESNWMANYLGHVKLIRVENGPADAGAIIVDPAARVAFNMGLEHPPADRLIKDAGDFRTLTDFLAQLPEHSTIVDCNYIHNDRGLCFNKKVAYTELEDNLARHNGLAEKLGITLHHRVNGIVPNSVNHMEGEAQRLQTYMREKFENARQEAGPSGP